MVEASFTGNRIVWGQLGGGQGNVGRLLQSPVSQPPEPSGVLLPASRLYCYPNPIRGNAARIRFYLGGNADVDVVVLNAIGEVVDRLSSSGLVPLTDNEIRWDTSRYASGVYICRVSAQSADRAEVRFVKAAVIK